MGAIRERYEMVRRRAAAAAIACGRSPDAVRVLAVSKTQPVERVVEAIEAGVDVVGENRVQEAQRKRAEMAPAVARRARWHLIGSLQRNKARLVPGLFDVVESVDSAGLARELNRRAGAAGRGALDVLIQVNTGEESQKGGVRPADAVALAREAAALASLRVVGFMCIPPLGRTAEESRPHFALLRELRDKARAGGLPLVRELSMGMSNDFEVAIAEGATLVRVGTAIFGPRGGGREEPALRE